MVASWSEVLGDSLPTTWAQDLDYDLIEDRLNQFPESWASLIHDLCTPNDHCDPAKTLLEPHFWILEAGLGSAIQSSPDDVWQVAFSSGLVPKLSEMLKGEFLCGFTREQLVPGSTQGRDNFDRVYRMLDLFLVCAERVIDDDRPREVAQLLDVLQDTIIEVYAKLWDIKDSFLVDEIADYEGGTAQSRQPGAVDVDSLNAFYRTLVTLGQLTVDELQEHRTLKVLQTRIPHVFLLIWIHAPQYLNPRVEALAYMVTQVNEADSETDPWSEFIIHAADGGCTGDNHIHNALMRDLEDENAVDVYLQHTLFFLTIWNDMHLNMGVNLSSEVPGVASSCLAAGRRQLCTGAEPDTGAFSNIASSIFDNLSKGLVVTDRQCYAFLDLFCNYVLLRLDEDNVLHPSDLIEQMEWAVVQLGKLRRSNSAKSVALRRHALAAWQTVMDKLRRRQLPQRSPAWRRFVQMWSTIKVLIPPVPDNATDYRTPFGVLARCGWNECLCSLHKPAHKMRVCKGCERVAYCGAKCQRSDWENGGHKEWCRMRGS